MNIRLVLHQQLSHFFAAKSACKHQRCSTKLVCLFDVSSELDQTSDTGELVVLNGQRDRRPSRLINRVNVCTLTDQGKDRLKRTILRSKMNRRTLSMFRCRELRVDVKAVFKEQVDAFFVVLF